MGLSISLVHMIIKHEKILCNPDKEIMYFSSMMKLGKTFGFVKDDESLDYACFIIGV